MTVFSYNHFFGEFEKGAMNGAENESISRWLSSQLADLCTMSLSAGDKAFISSIANSRYALEMFLDDMVERHFCNCYTPEIAELTIRSLAAKMSHLHPSASKTYEVTDDDAIFIKNAFNDLSDPALFVRSQGLVNTSLSQRVQNGLHPIYLDAQKVGWSHSDLLIMMMLGAQFDDETLSPLSLEGLPDDIKFNPVLAGISRANTDLRETHKLHQYDEAITQFYGSSAYPFILQVLCSKKLNYLSLSDEDNEFGIDGEGDITSEFYTKIKLVVGFASQISCAVHDLKPTTNFTDALDKAPDLEHLFDLIKSTAREHFDFQENLRNIDEMARAYTIAGAKINECASQQTSNYLPFISLVSSFFSDENYTYRAPALNGVDFSEMTALITRAISECDSAERLMLFTVLQDYIITAPLTAVTQLITNTHEHETLDVMMLAFHSRWRDGNNENERHFLNINSDSISRAFSHAELTIPGFGAKGGINKVLQGGAGALCDVDLTLQKYAKAINAEKFDSLRQAPALEANAEMSFLTPSKV